MQFLVLSCSCLPVGLPSPAGRIARNVIGVGSTTVPETRNSLHCLGISMAKPDKFWKCMQQKRKSTTTVVPPGMPWFNSMDAQIIVSKNVGDDAVLRCTVEDKGDRIVSWFRRDPIKIIYVSGNDINDISGSSKYGIETDNNRTFHLLISQLTREDNGTYACQVHTSPPIMWNVTLQIVEQATVKDIEQIWQGIAKIKKRTTFVFNESDTVELKCNGDGSPPPRLIWIGPTGQRVGNATLRIVGIQRSQAGEYRCEADNGLNDVPDFRLIEIKVNYKPEIRVFNSDTEIRKPVGGYVKMQCQGVGVPKVVYSWLKDGVPVPPTGSITRQSQTSLVIMSIQPDNYGVYTCEATNILGTASANITLNGKPLPPVIVSDPVGTRRHIFKLTWQHQSNQPPNYPNTIPVTYYKILYRGWWRQLSLGMTQDRRKVYSLQDETNLMEEIAYPDFTKVRQSCNLHDLRHNATYDLQLYAVNDQGDSEPVNFTFYTALEDEVTTSDGEAPGPISLSSKDVNPDHEPGVQVFWGAPSSAPSRTPSTVTVLTMVIVLVLGIYCTEVYK